jgi:hypothetical protein
VKISSQAFLLRLPIFLLVCFWGYLLVSLPLAGFNSDCSIIGYMGEDVANGEKWPVIMYGTDKQVSATPYVYGIIAAVTQGAFDRHVTLRIAGSFFSLLGTWLLYEALLLSLVLKERKPYQMLAGGFAFCLAIGTNRLYLFTLADVSLTEQYHFCVGLQIFLVAWLHRLMSQRKKVPRWLWVVFGVALGYSYIVRPNAFLFGIAGCLALVIPYWRQMLTRAAFLPFLGGFGLAYLPILFHKFFRLSVWPVGAKVPPLVIASFTEASTQFSVLRETLAYLFGFAIDSSALSAFLTVWVCLSLAGLIALVVKALRNKTLGTLVIEGTLLGGLLFVFALMVLVKGICTDVNSMRYCLAVVPIVAWWAVAGGIRGPKSAAIVVLVSLALTVLQGPYLKMRIQDEQTRAEQFPKSVQVLSTKYSDRVMFAVYWDAYEIDFLTSAKPAMVPFPFETTRLFGRHSVKLLKEKPLWLVEEARVEEIKSRVRDFVPDLEFVELDSLTLRGKPYLILESESGSGARLIDQFSPNYFTGQPALPSWANESL